MKLTKHQLKKIIREEISNIPGEEMIDLVEFDNPGVPGDEPPQPKLKTDVETLLKRISTINQPEEYMQLLNALLQHDVPSKAAVLRKLGLTRCVDIGTEPGPGAGPQ